MRHVPNAAIVCCAVFVLLGTEPSRAQERPAPAAPARSDYVFSTGAGVLVFHVRPERAQEFESVIRRLSQVLASSTDPVRRQQAGSWRMFRAVETTQDAALYVFVFDPAVTTADYDPVRILAEAAPAEAQVQYEILRAAVIKVEKLALAPVQ
ncbi:MAG: hypothetical protein IT184_06200 [Acidobacteria bacterium]|nr:hypothetical protein [Acidobacteriota bacterium]